MPQYRTKTGDMLDAICFKYYGQHGYEPMVLDANPGLSIRNPIYPSGLIIELPEKPTSDTKATVRLWD